MTHLTNNDVDGVDDSRNVTQDGQQQADPELTLEAILEEDAQRRQEDGQEHVHERVSTP